MLVGMISLAESRARSTTITTSKTFTPRQIQSSTRARIISIITYLRSRSNVRLGISNLLYLNYARGDRASRRRSGTRRYEFLSLPGLLLERFRRGVHRFGNVFVC